MSNGFLIKKLTIQNFRGYAEQEFSFFSGEGKTGLILLGGPNGYGKTSLLDAIEWCLTGTISRLAEDYRIRKEKTQRMQKGLLRYKGSSQKVRVSLEIDYMDRSLQIERAFDGDNEIDGLFSENTNFKVNSDEIYNSRTIDEILEQPISDEFYERYISSFEKNIQVYEKSRNDIYNMFSSFFGGNKEIETMINNLEGYNIGKKREKGLIDQLDDVISKEYEPKYKIAEQSYEEAQQKINKLTEERKNEGELSKNIKEYPSEKLFADEKSFQELINSTNSYQSNIENLEQQITLFKSIKFLKENNQAFQYSQSYVSQLQNIKKLRDFMERVSTPFRQLKEGVKRIQGKNLDKIQKEKIKLDELKSELKALDKPSKDGVIKLRNLSQKVIAANHQEYQNFLKIDDEFSEYENITNQLEGFKSTDIAINALRVLVDHVNGFHQLQDAGQKECPLCGSKELFADKNNELVKTAREILGNIDTKRANLQKRVNELEYSIDTTYNKFYQYLLRTIETEVSKLNQLIIDFDRTKELKRSCTFFKLNFEEINEEVLQRKKSELEQFVQDDAILLILEKNLLDQLENDQGELYGVVNHFNNSNNFITRDEFIQLDIDDKIDCLQKFIEMYRNKKEEIPVNIDIEQLKLELLHKKFIILEKVQKVLLNDKIIADAQIGLDKHRQNYKKEEKKYKQRQKELQTLKNVLTELKKLRKQWDRQVVEEIRDPFKKIYRRINRHTNIDEIKLIVDGSTKTMASLIANINDEEVSATNILSAGQLSVMALAIFITVAIGQKNNHFRCYFMDDPIQTMDDLNILSFIDLLRTELSSRQRENRFIDQLFFTTCDENLENLVTHKMKSFGVNYTHLHFTGYGKYEVRA